MEETKKELLESIVKERSEDPELINKADNYLAFQDALECISNTKNIYKMKKVK